MPALFLYHTPGACSRVTMNALEEAGLGYQDRAINLFKGEQKSPEYTKVNPKGKVPALKVDDELITENAAMLMYIHMLKPEAGLLPAAETPFEKAKIYADLIWCSGTAHPTVRQVRMPIRLTDGDSSGVFAKGVENLQTLLLEVEERVSSGRWWYGEHWSIMDVYLYWCYSTAATAEFSLAPYPSIEAHALRVQKRPRYQRALTRELAAMEKAGIELPGGAKLT